MMENPIPTIGRIVHYRLKQEDVDAINRGRLELETFRAGNKPTVGETFPMLIVRVWGSEPTSAVNGQVFLDGNDVLWANSVAVGDGPGTFSWPLRA